MLRALRKASAALAKFPADLGQDATEDEKTRQLKMKLLDSPQVLGKSCEEVFNAFDEARLFSDGEVASELLVNGGGSDKMQFKDIFEISLKSLIAWRVKNADCTANYRF